MSSILGSKRDNTEVFTGDSNKKLLSILEKYKQKHADSTANIEKDPFSNISGLKDIDNKYNIMSNKGGKRKTRKGRKGRNGRKTRKGRRR